MLSEDIDGRLRQPSTCRFFRAELAVFPTALTIHVQRVSLYFHVENLGHHIPDALDARVTELEQMITLLADQMIVLPETVTPLVLGLLVSELMADYQITVNQQFQRIVYRGPGNGYLLLFQANKQLISVEVVCGIIDLFEDGQSLLRLPQVSFSEVVEVSSPNYVELLFGKG